MPQVALADYGDTGRLTMSNYAYPSALHFNITGHNNVGAGGFSASYDRNFSAPPAPTSFVAYCIDLAQTFNWNVGFTVTETNPLTLFGAVKGAVLDRLFTQRYQAADTPIETAAFQLAVWEVISEAPSSSFGTNALGTGSFRATGNTSGNNDDQAIAMANGWLNTLTGAAGGFKLTALVGANNQDQIMASPIPEPQAFAMLLAGLGLLGFVARRRTNVHVE
jgi:hypothetical protein